MDCLDTKNTWRDGGWKSRKLWFSVFAVASLYFGMKVASTEATLRPLYESFVGGVVAISGMFLIGNVGAKWVSGKTATPVATPPSPKVLVGQSKLNTEASPEESSPQ